MTMAPPLERKTTTSQRVVDPDFIPVGLAFVQQQLRGLRPIEATLDRKLLTLFNVLGDRAAKAYRDRVPKETKTHDDMVNVIISDMDIGALELRRDAMYGGTYEATATLAAGGIEQLLEASIDIGSRDLAAERVLSEGGRRAGLLDLRGDTRSSLFATLEEAQAKGLGIPQTARLIRDRVPAGRFVHAGSKYRATMIARTEARYASNISVAEMGRAAGFEEFVAFDDRLGFGDADCVARDGLVVKGSEVGMESAVEHPNGTLSFSPVPRTKVKDTPVDDGDWLGFESDSKAEAWLTNNAALKPTVTSTERFALDSYKGASYGRINGDLRGLQDLSKYLQPTPRGPTVTIQSLVDGLDTAVAKAAVEENIVVHRAVTASGVPAEVGAVFTDRGYVSTSLRSAFETMPSGTRLLDIRIPKGANVISPRGLGVVDLEFELILPRDSVFRVIGPSTDGSSLIVELVI